MLSLVVDLETTEVRRFCRTIREAGGNREALLKVLGRVVLADSRAHFAQQGPGWPPRAEETEEKQESRLQSVATAARGRAEGVLRRKLRRDLRRAKRRFSPEAAERRYAILKEFERFVAGGREDASIAEGFDASKTLGRTRERLARAEVKVRGKLLGALAGANRLTVTRSYAEVKNRAPFSAVHNDGGRVGGGAQVPARPFLVVTPALLDKMADGAAARFTQVLARGGGRR